MNETLIREKLKLMAEYLELLANILSVSSAAFVAEPMRKYSAERLLELIVECAAGVNSEIAQQADSPATDYYNSFLALAQAGWISQDLAMVLAPYATLRDYLLHHYERVDVGVLHETLCNCQEPWKKYIAAVHGKLPLR